jgi:DNA repair protein SbcD/Mre11
MRFIHTADWHLGRLFYGVHLTEDQAYVLEQLVALVKDTKPDALVIAGDIYDRAVPPPEAIHLLDDVLSRIVLEYKLPVILVAGNHDSPERLGFGTRLLAGRGLYIYGSLPPQIEPVVIDDKVGPVYLYALPYADPPVVRSLMGCDTIQDHDSAMCSLSERVRQVHPESKRSVLITHAFLAGGVETESERPLSVGGAGTVNPSYFKGFDYVALGHLHRSQIVVSDCIQYSGSIMKYSFSEAEQTKLVKIIEMDGNGRCRVEDIPLTPRRDLRCIEGYFAEILNRPIAEENREDYIQITLLDDGPILDAMGRLRAIYPNILHIRRPGLDSHSAVHCPSRDHLKLSNVELYASFYSQVTGQEPTEEQIAAYTTVIGAWRQRQREGSQ